jgi:hypothetical protein
VVLIFLECCGFNEFNKKDGFILSVGVPKNRKINIFFKDIEAIKN